MYESNPQNYDFDDSTFDGDETLIITRWIYCINDDIIESLNNCLIVGVYTNRV